MPAMRRRFSLSVHGATLVGLIEMASALRLGSRPLQLTLEELPQLALPCILHWDMDHFVVLERVDRAGVTLLDPAIGRRRVATARLHRTLPRGSARTRAGGGLRRQSRGPRRR